jgi:hypothetical protein
MAFATRQLSNSTARKYFQHDCDSDSNDEPSCYFSQTGDDDGWGFWVSKDGSVATDDVSANGELPSGRIIEACVRAAKKYLTR